MNPGVHHRRGATASNRRPVPGAVRALALGTIAILLAAAGGGCGRDGGDGDARPASSRAIRLGPGSDSFDLTAHLLAAGGSPELAAGDPVEVQRIDFDGPDALARVRADAGIDGLRIEENRLVFGIANPENRITWECALDAAEVTHLEFRDFGMKDGRGPVLLLWQGPDDPPGSWQRASFYLPFDETLHKVVVPLEDEPAWRGRVTRMGLVFGIALRKIQEAPARVDLGGLRCLRMDLGTRRANDGLPLSIRRATLGNESRSVVHAPAPSRLSLPIEIPGEGASLAFGIGVYPSNQSKPGDGVIFRIAFADARGGGAVELFRLELDVKHRIEDRAWRDVQIPLGDLEGREGSLVFETLGGDPAPGDVRFDDALWAHPVIRAPRGAGGPPNVLLVSLDTLRADHLGASGYPRSVSPFLDRFARESIQFENAFAPAPETVATHMSLFTSLYPSVHGIRTVFDGRALLGSIPTLAALLAENQPPYRTAAFTEGGGVSSFLGFERGFERYHNGTETPGRPEKRVEGTFASARAWLRQNADQRFFLFLHTYEIHSPYAPPEPLDRLFDPDYVGPVQPPFGADDVERLVLAGEVRYGGPGLDRIVDLYDGGIRYVDTFLDGLVREMEGLGLLENTWIVLFSDHGEDFFDHFSVASHGHSVYDELIRVPLLVRPPGGRGEGGPERIEDPVGLVDLMPTLLDILEVPPPEGLQGTTFAPLLDGKGEDERPVYFEDTTGVRRYGVRYRGMKRILSPGIGEDALVPLVHRFAETIGLDRFEGILDEEQVFDVDRDPRERVSLLAGGQPDRESYLKSMLGEWIGLLERLRKGTGSAGAISPEELERLRKLGYQGEGKDVPASDGE